MNRILTTSVLVILAKCSVRLSPESSFSASSNCSPQIAAPTLPVAIIDGGYRAKLKSAREQATQSEAGRKRTAACQHVALIWMTKDIVSETQQCTYRLPCLYVCAPSAGMCTVCKYVHRLQVCAVEQRIITIFKTLEVQRFVLCMYIYRTKPILIPHKKSQKHCQLTLL